jgi:glycosyltransferase involved in cell wall biosynthesis
LDNAYVQSLYDGLPFGTKRILRSYVRRLETLLQRRRYDLIWIEKEALPWIPMWLERAFLHGVPYVVDFDDAWFHRYEHHPRWAARVLLGSKIDGVMERASVVVAGNEYLAQRARRAGARHVEVIPSVIDLARYRDVGDVRGHTNGSVVVGWIGTPLNAHYLNKIEPALRRLARHEKIILHIVGAKAPSQLAGLPVKIFEWREATEVDRICAFDMGIMPLDDSAWERGKCAYKLLQVMAAGTPVIASPVGTNSEVVRHGINGLLADSTEEWVAALGRLAADKDLRSRLGQEARRTIEDNYSLDRLLPRLSSILAMAAHPGRH